MHDDSSDYLELAIPAQVMNFMDGLEPNDLEWADCSRPEGPKITPP
jgi:hypothetical protein